MKQRPWKRALSLMLAFALVFAMPCVTGVYAAGEPVDYIERWWDEDEQKVMDSQKSVTNYTEVENSTTAWDGDTTGGWYVVSGSVEITSRVTVTGDVHLILMDGCTLTVNGGIQVKDDNSLTIYGQKKGSGTVKATGDDQASGIGGGSYESGGIVTIMGGIVEATGGTYAAGIGGGAWGGDGGTVTILGGTVTATSDSVTQGGAGIGGGGASASCTVTVKNPDPDPDPDPGKPSGGSGGSGWSEPSIGAEMPVPEPGGTEQGGSGQSGVFSQPAGCVSDTLGEVNVSGAYQFRLTSTNGTAPVVELDSTNFRAVLASQEGNDYFWKVYAVGLPGQLCTVTVNGTAVARLTLISSIFGGVSSDTTAPFTVPQGGSYQFCLTAVERPKLSAGSSSFVVEYVGNKGFDWFFRVAAVGKPGDGCGFYINGAPVPVAVAHIS